MDRTGRYSAARPPRLADGWRYERLTPPSRMYGANGMRNGPDGRIYVAQCIGGQVSALDVESGALETISPIGGDILSPDDLVFDDAGNMYVTEFMDGRVSVRAANGETRVVRDDVPGANGITWYKGRLFIDEMRASGRILELDPDGGAPRVLLEGVSFPNAMAPGPDGKLYFPVIGKGEIWRIDPDGGPAEIVVGGLDHPSAVKFDPHGRLVATIAPVGEVHRIDVQTGAATVLAKMDSALDNLIFMGDRLFVSHSVDGRVTEVGADGRLRDIVAGGLHGPLDMAVGDDGMLYFADQIAFYTIADAGLHRLGRMYEATYPGAVRGVAALPDRAFAITTASGKVFLYRPWEKSFDLLGEELGELYGIAVGPRGGFVVADYVGGRLISVDRGSVEELATGLAQPMGVAVASDGSIYVSETGAGRVVRIDGGHSETVIDGLSNPQGLALAGRTLFIVDADARAVIAHDLDSGADTIVAADLAVGAPPGVVPKLIRGIPPRLGPLRPFAGIAVGPDGTLYLATDAEGSVTALRPTGTR